MKFFKDKLLYIKKRHDRIREEMVKRGFKANKIITLTEEELEGDWEPTSEDLEVIKERLVDKIRRRNNYYRYYRKDVKKEFLIELVLKAGS